MTARIIDFAHWRQRLRPACARAAAIRLHNRPVLERMQQPCSAPPTA